MIKDPPTRAKVWLYILDYYREHKTTPELSALLTGLGLQREKLRRAMKSLIREGYVREDFIGNKKFYVILRMGEYRPY